MRLSAGENHCVTLDIEIHHETACPDGKPQRKYLVHTSDDVLWTDSIEEAVVALRAELERLP